MVPGGAVPGKLLDSEEMRELRLNIRGGKCYNNTAGKVLRPKIPTRLCKVTKV